MSYQYTQTLVKRMHSLRQHVQEAGGSLSEEMPRYGTWTEGFGHWANAESHDGFTGFDYHLAGAALGLDYLLEDNVLAGVSYSESRADIRTDGDLSQGDVDSYFGSLYGSYFTGRRYVDTTLSYGRQGYGNVRQIDIGDLSTVAQSDHDGDLYSAYAETGCNLDVGRWVLQPFAALRYLYLDEEGFRETGAGGANLVVGERKTDALISDLGLRLTRPFHKDSWLVIPELTAAWDHDFDIDDRTIVARFDGAPTTAFAIDSRDIDRDGVLLGAGLTLINKGRLNLAIHYIGEVRSHYDSQAVIGGLRYEF
ncbi:MAG: autotransporter outer membrane beta-barrel domain-containing protein [Planctomycetaceae bacterium]|nr:MAG: autotransporter outer membrane beta-barrel domain-containing protein [Planctomycetaceae bacterium]